MSPMTTLEILLTFLALGFLGTSVWLAKRLFSTQNELTRLETMQFSTEKLQETFRATAQSALTGNAEQFLQLAKSTLEKESAMAQKDLEKRKIEINSSLDPIKVLLTDYQRNLQEIEKERMRTNSNVENELKKIAEMGSSLYMKRMHLRTL